jgi:hypothetical protein
VVAPPPRHAQRLARAASTVLENELVEKSQPSFVEARLVVVRYLRRVPWRLNTILKQIKKISKKKKQKRKAPKNNNNKNTQKNTKKHKTHQKNKLNKKAKVEQKGEK